MADATIIDKIKKLDGCEKLGIKLNVRQANSWNGYDIYATTYSGGAFGGMRFYRIVDGEPIYIPFEEVMQMDGYDPWRGK